MSPRLIYTVILSLCVLLSPAISQVQYGQLANGVEWVIAPNPSIDTATVQVSVRAGSIHESPYLGYGLSHYLEHLVSGGTTTLYTEDDYKNRVAALGGASNAYTTFDHTAYFIRSLGSQVSESIDILYEWMFFSNFTTAEFEREKGVVTKEMQRKDANIESSFFWETQGRFYKQSPYRYPILGYTPWMQSVTHDMLMDYYKTHYVPGNMIVVVAGNVDANEVKAKIEASFGSQDAKPLAETFFIDEPDPTMATEFHDTENTPIVRMHWRFPSIRLSHPDLYALDLLAYVAGNGNQSIFYKQLVEEKKLAHSVRISSYTPQYSKGDFDIYVTADPENVEAIRTELWALIDELKAGKYNNTLIERAKTQKLTEDLLSVDGDQARARQLSMSMIYSHTPYYSQSYAERFAPLEKRDLQRVAQEYLDPNRKMESILWPESYRAEQLSSTNTETAADSITYHRLDNGLRVVLVPPSTADVSRLFIISLGGLISETPTNNGVSTLLASLIGKGSRRYTKDFIQSQIQDHGAEYFTRSGMNTVYSGFASRSEDFVTLMPLISASTLDASFAKEDIEQQKQLQSIMIETRSDNWYRDLNTQFMQAFYPDHPYGMPKMGTLDSLESIDREVLMQHYDRLLNPKTMVLVLSSDMPEGKQLAIAEKYWGKFSAKPGQAPISINSPPSHSDAQHWDFTVKQDVGGYFLAVDAPDIKTNPRELLKIDLLDALLSGLGYPSGPLHEQLRGQELVYETHAMHRPLLGTGMFLLYALSRPESLEQVDSSVRQILKDFQDKPVSDTELNLAKDKLKFYDASQVANKESQMLITGLNTLYKLPKNLTQKRQDWLQSITPKDIQTLAQKLFQNPQSAKGTPKK